MFESKIVKLPENLHPLGPKNKKLFPQFAPPQTWRNANAYIVFDGETGPRVVVKDQVDSEVWRELRSRILARDKHICRYCGFRAFKWQVVHHIDGDSSHNDLGNLETICPMCNTVLHAGLHSTKSRIIDFYKKSRYAQADVIRRTRVFRALGKNDDEIVRSLGLKHPVRFKMDRAYLRCLIVFVSSRPSQTADFTARALKYGLEEIRRQLSSN